MEIWKHLMHTAVQQGNLEVTVLDSDEEDIVFLSHIKQSLMKKDNFQNCTLIFEVIFFLFIILGMEWKIQARTLSNIYFSEALMDYPFYVIQSKLTFISNLIIYIWVQYEALHIISMVVKHAFVHLEIFPITRIVRQNLSKCLPLTSLVFYILDP